MTTGAEFLVQKDSGNIDRPWDPLKGINIRFFDSMSMHSLPELYAISEMCLSHKPERIVEYGTAMGGLTRLLGRWAFLTDAKVLSIENGTYASVMELPKYEALLRKLPVELLWANEYDQSTYERVQEFAAEHKTMFYCDGGNKPMELKSCAAILKAGDLLVTHDYELELERLDITLPPLLKEVSVISVKQAQKVIERENLEVLFEEYLGVDEETGKRRTRLLALRRKDSSPKLKKES